MKYISPPRAPWPPDFPDSVIHTEVHTRDRHPKYAKAKAGDANAAYTLAYDLLADQADAELMQIVGERTARLLPVVADELMGFKASSLVPAPGYTNRPIN